MVCVVCLVGMWWGIVVVGRVYGMCLCIGCVVVCVGVCGVWIMCAGCAPCVLGVRC